MKKFNFKILASLFLFLSMMNTAMAAVIDFHKVLITNTYKYPINIDIKKVDNFDYKENPKFLMDNKEQSNITIMPDESATLSFKPNSEYTSSWGFNLIFKIENGYGLSEELQKRSIIDIRVHDSGGVAGIQTESHKNDFYFVPPLKYISMEKHDTSPKASVKKTIKEWIGSSGSANIDKVIDKVIDKGLDWIFKGDRASYNIEQEKRSIMIIGETKSSVYGEVKEFNWDGYKNAVLDLLLYFPLDSREDIILDSKYSFQEGVSLERGLKKIGLSEDKKSILYSMQVKIENIRPYTFQIKHSEDPQLNIDFWIPLKIPKYMISINQETKKNQELWQCLSQRDRYYMSIGGKSNWAKVEFSFYDMNFSSNLRNSLLETYKVKNLRELITNAPANCKKIPDPILSTATNALNCPFEIPGLGIKGNLIIRGDEENKWTSATNLWGYFGLLGLEYNSDLLKQNNGSFNSPDDCYGISEKDIRYRIVDSLTPSYGIASSIHIEAYVGEKESTWVDWSRYYLTNRIEIDSFQTPLPLIDEDDYIRSLNELPKLIKKYGRTWEVDNVEYMSMRSVRSARYESVNGKYRIEKCTWRMDKDKNGNLIGSIKVQGCSVINTN